MPLQRRYEKQEAVPEALREYYVERDGAFVLDAPELEEAGTRALEHERKQRAEAVKKAEAAERRAKDAEAKLAAVPPPPDPASPPATGTGEAEKLKKEYDERIKAIEVMLKESQDKTAAAEAKLVETTISDVLRNALVEAGVPKAAVEDLVTLPKFRAPWRMADNGPAPFDGETPRLDPDAPTKNMSPKAYAKEFLKENPHWLGSSAGGGANGNGTPRSGATITVTRSEMKDIARYQAVQEQATKTGATILIADG